MSFYMCNVEGAADAWSLTISTPHWAVTHTLCFCLNVKLPTVS